MFKSRSYYNYMTDVKYQLMNLPSQQKRETQRRHIQQHIQLLPLPTWGSQATVVRL